MLSLYGNHKYVDGSSVNDTFKMNVGKPKHIS